VLSYSSAGIGSASHLDARLFRAWPGSRCRGHVPTRVWSPALVDCWAGMCACCKRAGAAHREIDNVRPIAMPKRSDRRGADLRPSATSGLSDSECRQLGRAARPGASTRHREKSCSRDHRSRHDRHEGAHQDARIRNFSPFPEARRKEFGAPPDQQRRVCVVRGVVKKKAEITAKLRTRKKTHAARWRSAIGRGRAHWIRGRRNRYMRYSSSGPGPCLMRVPRPNRQSRRGRSYRRKFTPRTRYRLATGGSIPRLSSRSGPASSENCPVVCKIGFNHDLGWRESSLQSSRLF